MSIQKRHTAAGVRWVVRWRADGRQMSKTFERRDHAQRFDRTVHKSLDDGSYLDPSAGKVTVAEYAHKWLATKAPLSRSTVDSYTSLVDLYVVPTLGDVQLRRLLKSDVQQMIVGLSGDEDSPPLSRERLRRLVWVCQKICDLAVADRRIAVNPVTGRFDLPDAQQREWTLLTYADVDALAAAAATGKASGGPGRPVPGRAADGLLVQFLAHVGPRWGEAAGLDVADVDLLRGQVRISKSWDSRSRALGPTKTRTSRTVPLAGWLVEDLAEHMAGRSADEPLFTSTRGTRLDQRAWHRGVWARAKAGANIDPSTRPHDLRHTAASWLVRVTDLKTAMELLGHQRLETTARYLHTDEGTKREAVEKLGRLRTGRIAGVGYLRDGEAGNEPQARESAL